MSRNEIVGIVGSGFIGQSWAMLFASVGYKVHIYDVKAEQVSSALTNIKKQLHILENSGMLRGTLTAEQQFQCISAAASLKDCIKGAKYVQESVFEDLELKRKVFHEIDEVADAHTVLASSTSCIVPSKFTADLTHRENCIVAHPVNPPYYVPMVEVVPAPWTSKEVVTRTQAMMKEIGQSPVMFSREQPGFGLNRVQYAILNECNNMVKSGILSAEDVDILMKDGLGYRYAWMGPLETAHLNANGMEDYLNRYGPTMVSVSKDFAPVPLWTVPESQSLLSQMEQMVPEDKLPERREWRDARLIALAKLKKEMKELEKSGK
ncbi:Crystallin, lambda 1 [Halocaridina rubra]|uniref:Crystallin, lambda 1 n=1 Tax=Halocaridina rubra TaxID=373956 RepID=A0AAN8WSY5_HALRR